MHRSTSLDMKLRKERCSATAAADRPITSSCSENSAEHEGL
jgi:hypothetical protein